MIFIFSCDPIRCRLLIVHQARQAAAHHRRHSIGRRLPAAGDPLLRLASFAEVSAQRPRSAAVALRLCRRGGSPPSSSTQAAEDSGVRSQLASLATVSTPAPENRRGGSPPSTPANSSCGAPPSQLSRRWAATFAAVAGERRPRSGRDACDREPPRRLASFTAVSMPAALLLAN